MKDEGFDHAHSSPIKTPKQLLIVVVLAFVIPVIGIIMLAQFVTSTKAPAPEAMEPEAVAQRIKPVADVVIAGSPQASAEQAAAAAAPPPAAPAAPAATGPVSGEQVYAQACAACHGAGVMGAPKFGDKGQWAARLGKGKDTLYASAIKGIGAMPPKGGNTALSDEQVKAAVDHMLAAVK